MEVGTVCEFDEDGKVLEGLIVLTPPGWSNVPKSKVAVTFGDDPVVYAIKKSDLRLKSGQGQAQD